jgi:hypothetical protein
MRPHTKRQKITIRNVSPAAMPIKVLSKPAEKHEVTESVGVHPEGIDALVDRLIANGWADRIEKPKASDLFEAPKSYGFVPRPKAERDFDVIVVRKHARTHGVIFVKGGRAD